MKDTENIYYLGRVLVDRPYRMIRHLLLMSLICFLAFQNVYGSFNKEGFLYAYLVSVFIFSFPIYMNIYQLLPRFLLFRSANLPIHVLYLPLLHCRQVRKK